MLLSLQDFTIVTPIILLLTFYSSFKNGIPTCEKYLFNDFSNLEQKSEVQRKENKKTQK